MESKTNKIELGWSYPKRKRHLDEISKHPTGKTQPIYFQNGNLDLPVHNIPIELPRYRIDNGRTYAAQAQYIAAKHLAADFFEKDQESETIQQAQHEILKGMIKEKGLLSYFKSHDQSEAIILSHDGIVINGNRRLCAWRELLNTGKRDNFSHVRAIILPIATQKDIDELEARLQVIQDIKAEYTWTSRALLLRNRKLAYEYTINDLAKLFEMSEDEIQEHLDMLSYAETYLEERNKIGQYYLVDRAEYAFRQLHKKRGRIKKEPYKEVFEKLAFCLIDASEKEGRLYQSIPDLSDNLEVIVEKVMEEFDLKPATPAEGVELLGVTTITPMTDVVNVISDEKNQVRIASLTIDIIEAEREKERERKDRNFVLMQVKKANTSLLEAVANIDSTTEKTGVMPQIESIESSLRKIKEWLNK